MELFDFIKTIFKPAEYAKVKQYEKGKFYFMLNRFMSISFPLQAQAFNHVKVSQPEAVDYWQSQMAKLYTRSPDWMFTKTGKKANKKKISWPSEAAVSYYLRRHNMSKRELQDAVKMFGDEALEPIFRLEKSLAE